jgi:hypothetical protein
VPLLRGMDTINNSPVPPKRSSVSFDGRRSEFLLHNRLTYLQPTIAHPHLSSTPSRTPLYGPCPASSIPAVCVPVETSEMSVRAAGGYVRCGVGGGGQGMLTFPRERHLTPQASCIPEDPPPPVNVVACSRSHRLSLLQLLLPLCRLVFVTTHAGALAYCGQLCECGSTERVQLARIHAQKEFPFFNFQLCEGGSV